MRIDILTLFPDTMRAMLGESILGRAQARGLLDIRCHQIRDYTENRQKQVDDYPYGGGWGQVMMAQPLNSCLDAALAYYAVPAPRRLEALSFRINAVGFVLWTFTLVAGAIWAEAAWGRYWGWDPKEVWTFVVWVVYAGYLHARTTRGWSGRRAAWFVVVGYATVIFNFTGVNLLFDGLHSYADVPGAD